jgi:hypothetical protein
VVSEKIAAAATAALVGVGVTATGGASVALSHEPREFLKPPVEASAQGIRDASEFAAQAAGSTVRQVTGVLKTTGVVDDATTGSLENVATAPAPAGPAASDDGSVPVADPAPGTASQEPSLSAPGVGPDPGSPVDPDVGDGAPQDTPAAVTNPAPPVDPAPSPTPSPQPSVPADGSFTVPLPETPAQDPGPPVDEGVSPSPSPAGGIAPGGGAGSQPSSSGSEPSTLESPAAGDALPGLSPSTEPSPTPVAGLGAVDDGMEVPGEGGLAG